MQTTTNLNLKKPEPGDYALVSDINDNMDILDTKVADVRDSKVSFTDADLDSGITSFPTFLTKIVSGMKMAKFLRDFKAGMGYVLHTGSLINNATCTESGKALDARMGKTLQDQITSLNDSFMQRLISASNPTDTVQLPYGSYLLVTSHPTQDYAGLWVVVYGTDRELSVTPLVNNPRFYITASGSTIMITFTPSANATARVGFLRIFK